MILRLESPSFRLFSRHALNTSRAVVYDEKPRGSDYSVVTPKPNGGKDVTPDSGFAGGKVLAWFKGRKEMLSQG